MVKDVSGRANDQPMSFGVRRGSNNSFRPVPILARKISSDDRVENSTVGMTGLTVVMVRLRVHVNQRNGHHPDRQPREDHQARPQHMREQMMHRPIPISISAEP